MLCAGNLLVNNAGDISLGAIIGPTTLLNADGSARFGTTGGNTAIGIDGSINVNGNLTIGINGTFDIVLNQIVPVGTVFTPDFLFPYVFISTAAQIDFSASQNRPAGGRVRNTVVLIQPNGGGARAFTFNASWVFLGAAAPVSIAANKTGILSLTCFGANETDVVAAYSVQP